MANQPNRQQPFRFWFPGWTNPPPRRTPTTQGRSQTRTPVTPSQPEAPLSQPPKQPPQQPTPSSPSMAQAPTNPPQPSPIAQGAPRTPPSSPTPSEPEPKRQPTLPSQVASQQPSSPSKTEPKRQSTLPSRVASQPPSPSSPSKPEPGRQSTSPTKIASQPSIPSPSDSQPAQKTQAPSPSRAAQPQPQPGRQSTSPTKVASQPSIPSPSDSQPAQKTQAPSPSRAAQPQPPGKTGSPPSPRSQGKSEPKSQATLPSQVASQPSSPSPNEPDQKPQPPSSSSEMEQKPQPPLPSSAPEQKPQPSPPSQGISPSQPATPGEARLPSPSPPTTLLTKPLPQEPQTALDSSSPTVPAPETQLQNTSRAQESVPEPTSRLTESTQPTVPVPETQHQNTSEAQESVPEPTTQLTESTQRTESGNQISQKLKSNQIPTDSPMNDVSGETTLKNPNKPLQESQPQEIKEKPVINPEQKQENKPDPEETTNSEVEVNREKISSVPEDIHTVRKAKEKQEMLPTQTLKPKNALEETKEKYERRADLKQNINPEKTSETEPISELIKKYNHLTKPEAHLNKPRDRASEESETKIEPRIAIRVADSRPNTHDLTSEIKMSKPEQIMQGNVNVKEKSPENGNGASSRESRIAISTIPKRVFADGEQANFQKEIKEGLSKLVQKLSTGQHPGGDQGVTIITLAGENKGATMILDSDEGSMQSNRGFKLSDKVGATRDNHVDQSDRADNTNPGITTSVNSNVQNINNSLLQDSSCAEGDPGVHLIISSKPKEPVYLIRKKEMLQSQKTNSSTLQPQKYTYETNVRRRCLRGLLLESSESDPDNPNKPRRHGCRVSCDDKKKGKAEEDGASASNGNRRNNKGKREEMF